MKVFQRKRSFEDVFKNHNMTASLSPANNAGDAKHESTDKTLYPPHSRTVAADYWPANGLRFESESFLPNSKQQLGYLHNWKRKVKSDADTDSTNVVQASDLELIELPNKLSEPPASSNWHIELELLDILALLEH
ncbi:hypothetical protein [Endozoicomonas acroporae]|uniref:hypothetical protein n=1 Tax=Endozoicomonas acroporae TaxID=1701104 RepID=UPI003D798BD0